LSFGEKGLREGLPNTAPCEVKRFSELIALRNTKVNEGCS